MTGLSCIGSCYLCFNIKVAIYNYTKEVFLLLAQTLYLSERKQPSLCGIALETPVEGLGVIFCVNSIWNIRIEL